MARSLLALAALAALAGPASGQAPALQPAWTLEGFARPESVALNASGDALYVSSIGGEGDARDGNGFISRISPDGRMLQERWATGFDAPKGMALSEGRLYVSDITRLHVVDAETGAIARTLDAAGSGFLNDVAVTPAGKILVSDSARARIYALDGDELTVWREGPRLRAINGLLPEQDRLIITTMAGLLLAMDYSSGEITELASGLGNGDGVAALGDGGYLVSEWPGRLFHVPPGGQSSTLLDERAGEVYMNDFLLVGDLLIMPNMSVDRVSAFRVAR